MDIEHLEDTRLITCVLPKDRGVPLIQRLRDEMGVDSANVTTGRTRGLVESISYGEWSEVDILSVVTSRDKADEVFDFLFDAADIDHPKGGLMYMGRLDLNTMFTLPEIEAG
ncbi:MAG: hypothetical protein HQL36_03820 [Alphaproteobacteria bacterium]|nr:hypothetical protein [Alphaproteobacteria bacterium]